MPCSLARSRNLQWFGPMPLIFCCLVAPPMWTGSIQDEVPSVGKLRSAFSVSPCTAIHKYRIKTAFRRANSIQNRGCLCFAKFVVDVDIRYFGRRDEWWLSRNAGEEICDDSASCLVSFVLVCVLPCCGHDVPKMSVPSVRKLRYGFAIGLRTTTLFEIAIAFVQYLSEMFTYSLPRLKAIGVGVGQCWVWAE